MRIRQMSGSEGDGGVGIGGESADRGQGCGLSGVAWFPTLPALVYSNLCATGWCTPVAV